MHERPRQTTTQTLPATLPVFPLPGAVLLPGGRLPLNIFESRYLNMVEDALGAGRLIGMIQPLVTADEQRVRDADRLYDVGCAGRIVEFGETGDGRYIITLEGAVRFRIIGEAPMHDGYRRVQADFSAYLGDLDRDDDADEGIDDRDGLVAAMSRYFEIKGISADLGSIDEAPDRMLVTSLAMSCPLAPGEKQALLECPATRERARLLTSMFEIAAHEGGVPPSATRQ